MANIMASVITIGDELLYGHTIDTNSAWIVQRMNDLGIDIIRRVAVGYNHTHILDALDREIGEVSIVFITGGLGPTADDITKPALCEYFGAKLVSDKTVLAHIRRLFTARNLPLLERNMEQALVPDCCTVLFNQYGTAPGMLFERDGRIVIAMPGVPHEMMSVMEEQVIPLLQQRFMSDAIIHRSVVTAGMGESFVAERIADLEAALPEYIRLAYLPGHRMVTLRLTGKAADKRQLIEEITKRQEEIANRLEEIVVSLEDLPLEQVIGKQLTVMEQSLGLAESCTGGYIGHRFTQVLGSSRYFQGGIICYQYDTKVELLGVSRKLLEENGAVCEDVAMQMAQGAMKVLGSDYGFGITGLLSPGGDDDKVPVGTVWMAVCSKERTTARAYHLPYDRLRNKEVAVNMALLEIWKFINGK